MDAAAENNSFTPAIPPSGGAIRSIGETFQANAFTGTAAFSVPIPTSAGRSGFGPKLSLEYDSGNGNGPFGMGWRLNVPRITRKTDKGLPKYDNNDVFVLSGAEDLTPQFVRGSTTVDQITAAGFAIRRYRPRTEGLFARIEQWTDGNADVHWRATTKDNVTSVYGRTPLARISAADTATPRVFEWLLEETYDARGNHVLYEYAIDDPALVLRDRIYEYGRSYGNQYLRRILYGNVSDQNAPAYADGGAIGIRRDAARQADASVQRYLLEVVFDYGDGGASAAPGGAIQETFGADSPPIRPDPFSSFRAGFEVRTLRRCARVVMFHHFAELRGPTSVRSTDFDYDSNPDTRMSRLSSITVKGHRIDAGGIQQVAALPSVTFAYSEFKPAAQRYQSLRGKNDNLPPWSLGNPEYALVDLFGEGRSDVLHAGALGFRYWRNLGNGVLDMPRSLPHCPAGLSLAQPGISFGDVDGDGRLELLVHQGAVQGFFEATPEGAWRDFHRYPAAPSFPLSDPNVRLIDLTGDGRADALMTRDRSFVWFECQGDDGYGQPQFVERIPDLEAFPDVDFNDPSGRVRLADMNGDGLVDIVLLHEGRVDYWPNLGYGRFGRRITMGTVPDSPVASDGFDPKRLFLADLDGTGCADLVYVETDRVHFWFNQSGNAWSARQTIAGTPPAGVGSSVQFADIFGTGTSALLWSYDAGMYPGANYKVLDFCGGEKPHLLVEMNNGLGAVTRVQYASSTEFEREDRENGHPWVTNLPFPVQVVRKVETIDTVSRTKLTTAYRYRHGYFDGREREFRGFAYVERTDTEYFDSFSAPGLLGSGQPFDNALAEFHVPPVVTRTWHHTGAYFKDGAQLAEMLATEFYRGDPQAFSPGDHIVEAADAIAEAYRALRGSVLRQEIYALDGAAMAGTPYTVTESSFWVKNLQARATNLHAVYFTFAHEKLTHHYERNAGDPRVAHEINWGADDFGNLSHGVTVGYPRRGTPPFAEQGALKAIALYGRFINTPEFLARDAVCYFAGIACETRRYEITGLDTLWLRRSRPLPADAFTAVMTNPDDFKAPEDTSTAPGKRLLSWTRTYFRRDAQPDHLDSSGAFGDRLPFGKIEPLGLPYETCQAVFSPGLLRQIYSNTIGPGDLQAAGYLPSNTLDASLPTGAADYCWASSGRQAFDPNSFCRVIETQDPHGNATQIAYDRYGFLVTSTTDPVGNTVGADYDYRVLLPKQVTDPNGNFTQAAYDALGLLVAIAVGGKNSEGDSLADFAADLSPTELSAFFANPTSQSPALLGSATSRFVYDLTNSPPVVATLARETHADPTARIRHTFAYSDGFGRVVQTKTQAEPGPLDLNNPSAPAVNPRWVGTGWTIFNNKAKPVQQYEPFFSATHGFEFNVRRGVTPTLFYDPLDRVVCAIRADQTYEKMVFDPWKQANWDSNDTVLLLPQNDPDVGGLVGPFLATQAGFETWFDQRIPDRNHIPTAANRTPDQDAAVKASAHAATPTVTHLDSLARVFRTERDNGVDPNGSRVLLATIIQLDIQGRDVAIIDPRGVTAFQHGFDLLNRKVSIASRDGGLRLSLLDLAGKVVFAADANGNVVKTSYDPLRRPTDVVVTTASGQIFLAMRTVYGEAVGASDNHCGRVYQVFDSTGVATNVSYDFKGNPLVVERLLLDVFDRVVDWSAVTAPTGETFGISSRYDALNRVIEQTAPDGSIFTRTYNVANLLTGVAVQLAGETSASDYVGGIVYNEKGQRQSIRYGNGLATDYHYDSQSFRLVRITSARTGASALQDLTYTYDAVGNITRVRDDAFQTVFNAQQRVDPASDYTYDAIYRLTRAKGREHEAMTACHHTPDHWKNSEFIQLTPQPVNNGQALRNYTELYGYDASGNVVSIQHVAGAAGGWTRNQTYATDSNRLATSDAGCGGDAGYAYAHDANGNILQMPGAPELKWDFANRLVSVTRTGNPSVFCVYDSMGTRTRKVIAQGAQREEERIYLGNFEIFRRFGATGVTLERQTLHVMDDTRRVALIEVRTQGAGSGEPAKTVRYQLTNHLGSALCEVDDAGATISYEEYYPYGGTAYLAGDNQLDVGRKRYRYCGKERDDETGLYYFGARYYAPWLIRWVSADPSGARGGINLFEYAGSRPTILVDRSGLAPSPPDQLPKPPPEGEPVVNLEEGLHKLDQYATKVNDAKTTTVEYQLGRNTSTAEWKIFRVDTEGGNPGAEVPQGFDMAGHTHPEGAMMTYSDVATTIDRGLPVGAAGRVHTIARGNGIFDVISTEETATGVQASYSQVDLAKQLITEQGGLFTAPAQSPLGAKTPINMATTQRVNIPSGIKNVGELAEQMQPVSGWTRFMAKAAAASEVIGKGVKILRGAVIVVGAYDEAKLSYEAAHGTGFDKFGLATTTFALGVFGGAMDDVAFCSPLIGLEIDSWDQNGAGSIQHEIGEANRALDAWMANDPKR